MMRNHGDEENEDENKYEEEDEDEDEDEDQPWSGLRMGAMRRKMI